jgi:dUTP pyrophosphatase
MGIIDETYCGPNDQWFMPAFAMRDTTINVNDRICQFRIMTHQLKVNFVPSTLENNDDRGGHGSTGKN